MDDTREVCFEQRIEKLYESGFTASEISHEMGVDKGRVEALISFWNPRDGGEDV